LMWQFTLGALLVRAGATVEGPSQQRALRGAPDPERHPTLAAAATEWRAAHGADTYIDDMEALLDALLPEHQRVARAPGKRSGTPPAGAS
jgi:hypothetical protein